MFRFFYSVPTRSCKAPTDTFQTGTCWKCGTNWPTTNGLYFSDHHVCSERFPPPFFFLFRLWHMCSKPLFKVFRISKRKIQFTAKKIEALLLCHAYSSTCFLGSDSNSVGEGKLGLHLRVTQSSLMWKGFMWFIFWSEKKNKNQSVLSHVLRESVVVFMLITKEGETPKDGTEVGIIRSKFGFGCFILHILSRSEHTATIFCDYLYTEHCICVEMLSKGSLVSHPNSSSIQRINLNELSCGCGWFSTFCKSRNINYWEE